MFSNTQCKEANCHQEYLRHENYMDHQYETSKIMMHKELHNSILKIKALPCDPTGASHLHIPPS